MELQRLIRMFEDSEDATYDARERAERDRDYYDGKQYTSAELKILRDRGQPARPPPQCDRSAVPLPSDGR